MSDSDNEHGTEEPQTLRSATLSGVAEFIKSDQCRNIYVMVGAGMSVSAGIPDFRSPKTGLYANLAKLGLPRPEAVFDLSFFIDNPKPFYTFAKDFDPSVFRPTISHSFLTLLHKKGLLRLCFTQNIDGLEERAHLPADALVQAHGSIASQHCVKCKAAADGDSMWKSIREGEVYYCTKCGGAVKPDIVFFGESLPARFLDKMPELQQADILLIFGTSLQVHPFADLTWCVTEECPRVLFNLEEAGDIGERGDDVLVLDQCDSGVRGLARMLGWEEELEAEWATTALPAMSAQSDKAPETSTTEAGQVRAQDDVEELAADIARTLKVEDVVPTSKIEVGGLKDEGLALIKGEKSKEVRPDTVETKVDAEAETRSESKVVDVDDHIASK